MNLSNFLSSLVPSKKSVRFSLYTVIILLMGFLNGPIDLIIHPETPFFCREHYIIGGIMILLTMMLCSFFEVHIQKQQTYLPFVKTGFYAWLLVIFWSSVIICSLTWNIQRQKQENIQVATNEARTLFDKDLSYHHWATDHKGVYVPITKRTPPNPYLTHLPESTGTTATGVPLTLVNPEYMIRQVYEMKTDKKQCPWPYYQP